MCCIIVDRLPQGQQSFNGIKCQGECTFHIWGVGVMPVQNRSFSLHNTNQRRRRNVRGGVGLLASLAVTAPGATRRFFLAPRGLIEPLAAWNGHTYARPPRATVPVPSPRPSLVRRRRP